MWVEPPPPPQLMSQFSAVKHVEHGRRNNERAEAASVRLQTCDLRACTCACDGSQEEAPHHRWRRGAGIYQENCRLEEGSCNYHINNQGVAAALQVASRRRQLEQPGQDG